MIRILQNYLRVLSVLFLSFISQLWCHNTLYEKVEEFFKDTLLVIHYNHAYYDTIDFEKELYSPIFRNIVFYGPSGHHQDVKIVDSYKGFYFSKVVKDVLENHPGYEGYIFLQDDCLMQFWNLIRLNKNKIWFCQNSYENFMRCSVKENWFWWFSDPACGMSQVIKKLPLLTNAERNMMASNFGPDVIPGQMCDMFYVPGHLSKEVKRLSALFEKVFCEISIATLLSCIDYLPNWEKLNYFWTCSDWGESVRANYHPDYDWMHSLKYSLQINKDFARNIFNKNFYQREE